MKLQDFLNEKISDMDMGDVIKDFYKSDAPQFKGKSKKKRRQMAIAAKLATESSLDGYYLSQKAAELWVKDNPGKQKKDFFRAGVDVQDKYTEKAGGKKGEYRGKGVSNWTVESLEALARHVKEGVPLPDSLFRYQSEAYFDTFKTAKKLREAGSLPELDWESEEMLSTDIGESVELKGVGRVWLDVPYLNEDESIEEAEEGMIGEPDNYYDAEERKEAYNQLQDALAQSNRVEAEYVKDGHCPECPNVEDDEDCYGFGNYGCDDGELTYDGDTVSWKAIKDHDERQAQRQQAKANYPGDEEVIKQAARMMPNMDDPRMIVQQIRTDYPQLGRAKASDLAGKAKQIAFPESVEIDRMKNLAGLNELKDERTDIEKLTDLLKDAIGPDNSGGDMYELYAELESIDSEQADEIKLLAKEMYGVKLEEGKSPHKKGSAKYKKHMAAMHAEAVRGRPKIDGEATEIQKIEIGGVEREFIRKGEMWHSTDPKYPMKYGYQTPMGQKIAKGRKRDLAKTTPSYQAKLNKNKVMASEAEYQGKDVELNKPKRGGSKKYYVYVKNPKTGNVKKISFGDPGLKTKSGNKDRAKSFAARHNCEKKNDKTKAGYWACRLPRYGLVKGGKWW